MKKNSGKQTKAIPLQYDKAEVPEEKAKELIAKYHSSLVNAKIAFLYKNKKITHQGREVIAQAKKAGHILRTLSDYDFVIVIAYEAWNNLTDAQKLAVLDHELSHCFIAENESTGEQVNRIIPHDFSDFNGIIKRHGLYMTDLAMMGYTVRNLDDDKEAEAEVDVDDD